MVAGSGLGLIALIEVVLRLGGWGLPRGGELPGWNPIGLPFYSCQSSAGSIKVCKTTEYYQGIGSADNFLVPKAERVVRIFSMGGSTTAGSPFYKPGAFSYFLELALNVVDPFIRYEVINSGVEGFSSFEVGEVSREVLGYDPDLIVLYMGNNEFYSTRQKKGRGPWRRFIYGMNKLLIRSRVYKYLDSIKFKLLKDPGDIGGKSRPEEIIARLREFQARSAKGAINDAERKDVIDWYRENLIELATKAKKRGVKVLLCTVPVNLRGVNPFEAGDEYFFADGCRSIDEKKCGVSIGEYRLDKKNAGLAFSMGCCAAREGKFETAKSFFREANDRSPVTYRATSSINRVIRETALSEGALLADVERAFIKAAKDGIPGDDMFLDFVHPTLEGQALIALTILDKLVREGVVSPVPDWQSKVEQELRRHRNRMPAEYLFDSYYTSANFNMASGNLHRASRLFEYALKYSPGHPDAIARKKIIDEILERGALDKD